MVAGGGPMSWVGKCGPHVARHSIFSVP